MRRFLLIGVLFLLMTGCEKDPLGSLPSPPSPSRTELSDSLPIPCPEVAFEATHLVDGVSARPERGPVEELGSFADMIWTRPAPGPLKRIIGIELLVGRTHYTIADPRPVTVRGVRALFGLVEDGYGIEWWEGPGLCGFFHLELFGDASEAELIRFVDGLRRTS
ncbi:MAG: hypothetical protein ACRDKS_03590 [Actinomycetota bacterium]